MMKKRSSVLSRPILLITCIMMCVLFIQGLSYVKAEDSSFSTAGGKRNGTVSVDPVSNKEGFSAVLYNNANGLPTSEANDIVQTKEGFIWIGSYSGLIRYDGSHFESWENTTGIVGVKCLYVDSSDRLWVGTNDNGVILIDKGNQHEWNVANGLRSNTIRSICEGDEGHIYIATAIGLAHVNNDLELSYLNDTKTTETSFKDVRKGANGIIYCLTDDGDVFTLKNGKVDRTYTFSKDGKNGLSCFLPDPENPELFYFENANGQVYHDAFKEDDAESQIIDIWPLFQVDSFEYLDGDVWVCARNGAGVIKEDGFHILEKMPMNSSIGHVMSDYEGNLWFTSTREGVMKIVSNRFMDIFDSYDLEKRVVNSTCIYDGKLFIATDTGMLALDDGKTVSEIPLNEPVKIFNSENRTDNLLTLLDNCRIRSLIRDRKDRLWISTWRSYGLLCYDHGDLKVFNKENGMPIESIRTVYECRDGRILSAGNGGVAVIDNDEVVATFEKKDSISNDDILNVTEGENGDLILGSDGGGIFIINKDGIKQLGYAEGLSSNSVMKIKKDKFKDIYWIVTGNSLAYMNNKYEINTVRNFPCFNNFDVYENSKQELWVLSSDGIYIAKIDDILSDDDHISTVHYRLSDGLPYITTANSYSELTEEGNLYICGTSGVAKVNIESFYDNTNELKLAIPYVKADEQTIYPDSDGRFNIPASTKKLTIYGYVFNYSLTEPMVEYQLKGFDLEKNRITPYNTFPVYYTNLSGGDYNFTVDLKFWNEEETISLSVEIIKEKAFFEQPMFYVTSTIALIGIIFGLVGLYEYKREAILEKRHKEETEKQRIANELSMGSNIQFSMLPHEFPPFPDRTEFDLYALMDPAREVGGDFYDFFFIDDDHLCLIMADVSGKGIPGALFMMLSKTILHNTAVFGDDPAEILRLANELIYADNAEQMFVTVWLGILQISTGKLIAANAGHEYPIFKMPDGKFEVYKDKHGFVLGGMEDLKYKNYDVDLLPGSKLFLYTDGVPEATNFDNKMYGLERLTDALNSDPDADPKQLSENVRASVEAFVGGAEQFDDLTMMVFEYKGPQENEEDQNA